MGRTKETIRMLASQRALFDIPREICYLNAASYSPLPIRTLEAGARRGGAQGNALDAPGFLCQRAERTRADRCCPADQCRTFRYRADPLDQLRRRDGGKASDDTPRHARDRAGKRSLLPGAGMARAGGGARVSRSRRFDSPDDGDWTSAVLAAIERSGAAPVSLASISSVHWSDGGLIDVDKVSAALRRQARCS